MRLIRFLLSFEPADEVQAEAQAEVQEAEAQAEEVQAATKEPIWPSHTHYCASCNGQDLFWRDDWVCASCETAEHLTALA